MGQNIGVCRNQNCPKGVSGERVELYPGPGEYCPDCGEPLEAIPSETQAPFGGLSPLEALEQLPPEQPQATAPSRQKRRPLFAGLAVVTAAVAAVLLLHPSIGRTGNAAGVRVCTGSITDRFARDLIRGYAEHSTTPESQYSIVQSAPCDVRLAASANAHPNDTIAHDALVAVVNPANPLVRLTQDAVRGIYSGQITDWSQVGGKPGKIIAYATARGTDETADPMRALMQGTAFGSNVQRLPSSMDVTRAVVRTDSFGAIGLVAFSQSDPAKVLAIGTNAPNPLSIAEGRYPFSVGVTSNLESSGRPAAAALNGYARSDDAQVVVAHSGLVTKRGI
ncbi:MAG: substrate-binding domain-containing protein [Vulcanimicrobiaceae bacterium]